MQGGIIFLYVQVIDCYFSEGERSFFLEALDGKLPKGTEEIEVGMHDEGSLSSAWIHVMKSGLSRRYSSFASGEIPAAIKLAKMFLGLVLSISIG